METSSKNITMLQRPINSLLAIGLQIAVVLLVAYGLSTNPFNFSPPVGHHSKLESLYSYSGKDLKIDDLLSGESLRVAPQEVTLPDIWFENHPEDHEVLYQLDLPDELFSTIPPGNNGTISELWSVYVTRATGHIAVYLNNIRIGQNGDFDELLSWQRDEPLLFNFPQDLLLDTENQLVIHMQAQSSFKGLLGRVYVAPQSQLLNTYNWRHFFRIDFVVWNSTLVFLLAIMITILWCFNRRDNSSAYYAIAGVLVSSSNLYFVAGSHQVSPVLFEAFWLWSLFTSQILSLLWIFSVLNLPFEKESRALKIFAAAWFLLFLIPDTEIMYRIIYPASAVLAIGLALYVSYCLSRGLKDGPNIEWVIFSVLGLPNAVCRFYDMLYINHVFASDAEHMGPYFMLLSYLLVGFNLGNRFLISLQQSKDLAESLDLKITLREQQLAEQYGKMQILENERTLANERERLMRDIHDGVGGQMVSLLTSVNESTPPNRIKEKLRALLSDFRFVIDSMDTSTEDLPGLLGTLRFRIEENLLGTGITLDWKVTDLPSLKNTNPSVSLNVIATGTEHVAQKEDSENYAQIVFIDIIDYGGGFNNATGNGQGLNNMQHRAEAIDAKLLVRTSNSGTRIRVSLAAIKPT
jgi:signal transduction histidine kinase